MRINRTGNEARFRCLVEVAEGPPLIFTIPLIPLLVKGDLYYYQWAQWPQ